MKMIYTIIIVCVVLLLGLFTSCKMDKFSEADLEWQPYKVGDSLIFESNKGELKTIVIKNIESHIGHSDPLAIFPDKWEYLFVTGKDVPVGIIKMSAGKEGGAIYFELQRFNEYTLRHPSTVYKINEIKKMDIELISNKKVFKIEAIQYYDNLKDIPFDLRYIYWSKEYGYVKFEYESGYEWTLKSLLRNGVDIWN